MEDKNKKSIIYIDLNDDITDVINAIKDSPENYIYIIPPKGIGVLRSAVNIKLLARTSKKLGKKIAIITNNKSLRSMSAMAKIPVAKTLQGKPEIVGIDALSVDGDDIIEGGKLPVSEFEKIENSQTKEEDLLEDIDIENGKKPSLDIAPKKEKKKSPIPNFSSFRKKVFIFGLMTVLILVFLFWANVIAPRADIVIVAKTSNLNLDGTINLSKDTKEVDASKNIVPLKVATLDKDSEIEIEATGTKEVGEAAAGDMVLSQTSESDPVVIKAGTAFSASGCNFVTLSVATIPGVKVVGGSIRKGETSVKIRATQIGEQCNLAPQKYISPIQGVFATGGQLSGGSKKSLKVLSEKDVAEAKNKLAEVKNDSTKSELLSKISDDNIVIDESFSYKSDEVKISANVGDEINGKVSAKTKTTYSISYVSKVDMDSYISSVAQSKVQDMKNQKVFPSSASDLKFSKFSNGRGNPTIWYGASVKIGPDLNIDDLKARVKGDLLAEARSKIETIEGIIDVKINFSYFWVNRIPDDPAKTNIDFKVNE